MNNAQLLQAVTQLQLRLLGRLLLDTPEDVAPMFAAALLRARFEHEEKMTDRRRDELVELVALLERATGQYTTPAGVLCMYPLNLHSDLVEPVAPLAEACKRHAEVWIQRASTVETGKLELVRCCGPHALELLERGDGWSKGVAP